MTWIRNWFSNFEPFERPVEYQGIRYRTPEHLYQALKLPREDVVGRGKIAAAPTAAEAKRMGRAVVTRSDWEATKVAVMRFVLRKKFAPGTRWLARLLETTGEIVEVNRWHDNTWSMFVPALRRRGEEKPPGAVADGAPGRGERAKGERGRFSAGGARVMRMGEHSEDTRHRFRREPSGESVFWYDPHRDAGMMGSAWAGSPWRMGKARRKRGETGGRGVA